MYYVYLLIDPRTGKPFYVGKGRGRRMLKHEKRALRFGKTINLYLDNKIRQIKSLKLDITYEKWLESEDKDFC